MKKRNKLPTKYILIILGIVLSVIAVVIYRNFDTRSSASLYSKAVNTYKNLPDSNVNKNLSNSFTFETYSTNPNKGKWLGIDENQVFWKRLEHVEKGKNWTIKLGKGGQIFSISTPELGELIPEQRVDAGQWVDEVFQHTIPSTIQKEKINGKSTVVDGDIHQAGYYIQSDYDRTIKVISKSVYSPTFDRVISALIGTENSYSFITWPQHAHLPRTYKDNGMLMHEQIRDLGAGVIEITLIIDKWSGVETKAINLPWSAFRTNTLPNVLVSREDNTFDVLNKDFTDSTIRKYFSKDKTGGWIAVTNGVSPISRGIGIVFEKDLMPFEGQNSYLQWGTYSSGATQGTVVTNKRDIVLNPGDSVFVRYYLIIGRLSDIQKYGKILSSRVQLGKIDTTVQKFESIAICKDTQKLFRRGCIEGSSKVFTTDRYFVKGSYPLFLLKDTKTSKYYISDDPYSISDNPTDNKTEYAQFLGWGRTTKPTTTQYSYVSLSTLVPASQLKLDNIIYVRK